MLLRRDVDYLVRDGRIGIIDELTGRVVPDRHWPDGLQAALEAKEGVERQADGRILGSMTLQHFLRGYPRLCGMTGTARTAAAELKEFYGLGVVVIPTHRPMIRVDHPDVLFAHREAKERAVLEEVVRAHATERPVLVGTLTVEESERLAERLNRAGVVCQVLNAKNDAAEALVVARAGAVGAVTISTNMAGRGTDIRLGGPDEAERDRVVSLGGLYVVGTNRHESRRIDLQLRGRAGRQGDPGESRFFVSLEDEVLVRYGIQGLLAGRFSPDTRDEPIDNPVAIAEVARAQRIVEGQNFEIRKTLWRYAFVLEEHRRQVMERRQSILEGRELPDVWSQRPERHDALTRLAGEDAVRQAERSVTLHYIDRAWCDHLALAADLREGIHLVSLGGLDPLKRFTTDLTMAFHQLEGAVDEAVLDALDRIDVSSGRIDLSAIDIKGPSSTWTYLVNDDPFRNQIGMLLTGPGKATFAIGAALFAWPLLDFLGIGRDRVSQAPGAPGGCVSKVTGPRTSHLFFASGREKAYDSRDSQRCIGQTFGHFQILEKIGEGGMGVVYKARDTHLDRLVAIKVLPADRVADHDRRVRFVHEAKAASALNHPGIVTIHDIAEHDGTAFMAMELVAGRTLDQVIPRYGLGSESVSPLRHADRRRALCRAWCRHRASRLEARKRDGQ